MITKFDAVLLTHPLGKENRVFAASTLYFFEIMDLELFDGLSAFCEIVIP